MSDNGNAMVMRSLIGCGYPDTGTSPGSVWLTHLYNTVHEAWDYGRFAPDSGEDDQTVISGLCDPDSMHPYTHEAWKVFVDLVAYDMAAEISDGMELSMEDPTGWARTILSLMAEQGVAAWVQDKREMEGDE